MHGPRGGWLTCCSSNVRCADASSAARSAATSTFSDRGDVRTAEASAPPPPLPPQAAPPQSQTDAPALPSPAGASSAMLPAVSSAAAATALSSPSRCATAASIAVAGSPLDHAHRLASRHNDPGDVPSDAASTSGPQKDPHTPPPLLPSAGAAASAAGEGRACRCMRGGSAGSLLVPSGAFAPGACRPPASCTPPASWFNAAPASLDPPWLLAASSTSSETSRAAAPCAPAACPLAVNLACHASGADPPDTRDASDCRRRASGRTRACTADAWPPCSSSRRRTAAACLPAPARRLRSLAAGDSRMAPPETAAPGTAGGVAAAAAASRSAMCACSCCMRSCMRAAATAASVDSARSAELSSCSMSTWPCNAGREGAAQPRRKMAA
eukprot:364751-Chlamydomonas_euryale.AAC.6